MSKRYYGASIIGGIFKGLAIIWIIAGVYAASELNKQGITTNYQIAAVAGGVVAAAWCAFFGYVVSLLRDIAMNGDHYANPLQNHDLDDHHRPPSNRIHY